MKKYILEILVFFCGAVVMILELVGTRIVAPFLGTSIIVWTSLIGVILASLSLGYWWGGRISDQNPNYQTFSLIILGAAVFTFLISFLGQAFLIMAAAAFSDIRILSLVSSIILFSAPSVLLGMVSPYAVRLKIKDVEHSGRTVGNLYAVSTAGSIFGTFLGGFFLISFLGSTKIIVLLSAILVAASLAAYAGSFFKEKLFLLAVFFAFMPGIFITDKKLEKNQGIIDRDTKYSRIIISRGIERKTKRPIRMMSMTRGQVESAVFLDKDDDLVFDYAKYYRLAEHFNPRIKTSLLLGGGAFTYVKDYFRRNPRAELDVVEIDPALLGLAKSYFNFEPRSFPGLAIFHEDARTFLNRTASETVAGNKAKKYDAIFVDVFKSIHSLPFQLTTKEAIEKMRFLLDDGGVVIVNILSALESGRAKFLRAEYLTYKSVFPQVYLFPVEGAEDENKIQNVILLALKSDKIAGFRSDNPEYNEYLGRVRHQKTDEDLPVLTDDFAPVDNYIAEAL